MEEKIKEVQDYFKSKILAGEFELVTTCQFTVTIAIEEKYSFCFWLSRGLFSFSQYGTNSIVLNIEQNQEVFDVLNKSWSEDRIGKVEAETKAKIKELRDQLKTLKQKQ